MSGSTWLAVGLSLAGSASLNWGFMDRAPLWAIGSGLLFAAAIHYTKAMP